MTPYIVFIVISVFTIFGIYKTRNIKKNFFAPQVLVPTFVLIYGSAAPLRLLTNSDSLRGFLTGSGLANYYLAIFLFILGSIPSIYFGKKLACQPIAIFESSTSKYALTTLLVLVIPFVSNYFNPFALQLYADTSYENRISSQNDIYQGVTGYFITGGLFYTLTAIFSMLDEKAVRFRFYSAIFMSLFILTSILSGSRSMLMLVVSVYVLSYNFRKVTLRPIHVILCIVAALFVLNSMSMFRYYTDYRDLMLYVFNEYNPLSMITLINSNEFAVSDNLLHFIESMDQGTAQYRYGENFLSFFTTIIPRFFWEMIGIQRPPSSSEYYMFSFFPDKYINGEGYGNFIVMDGYQDFGLVGVFLYSVFFFTLLQALYNLILANKNHSRFFYSLLIIYYTSAFVSTRSGIGSTIKDALFCIMFLMLWYWLIKVFNCLRR